MPKEKKVKLYVGNSGGGHVSIADSFISIRDFPNKKEGKQAVGVLATPVEMPESHEKAFVGVVKARFPHQLNVLTAEEYEAVKKLELEKGKSESEGKNETTGPPPLTQDEQMEKAFYDAAMKDDGGATEIDEYMEAYPEGKYINEVIEKSTFLVARANNTKKAFKEYLTKYPQGKYVTEVNTLLAG